MALVPCRECGHQVATTAPLCPNCGIAGPAVEAASFADTQKAIRAAAEIERPSARARSKRSEDVGARVFATLVFAAFFGWVFFGSCGDSDDEVVETPEAPRPLTAYEQRFGREPTLEIWDGGLWEVERALQAVANDPGSIDVESCTEPEATDIGWQSTCTYFGNNAFGAKVRSAGTFVIRDGIAIEIAE